MSDPKPQTFEEAYEEILKVALTTVLNKPSYEWMWNKSRATFFVETEQEKAVAVAAAEEATILELLGDAHTLCRVSNWTEDGDYDIGDVVASEAKVDRKIGALARALDLARAESSLREAELIQKLQVGLSATADSFERCMQVTGNDQEVIDIRLQEVRIIVAAAEAWLKSVGEAEHDAN